MSLSEIIAAAMGGAVSGLLMFLSGRRRGYDQGYRYANSLRPPPGGGEAVPREQTQRLDELFVTLQAALEKHHRNVSELQRSVEDMNQKLASKRSSALKSTERS